MILGNGASAQTPIVIKFSHVVSSDTTKGKGALKFKELAEERTKGKVKVEVFPNSQLYKDKEEIEALQLGAVQMLAPAVSKFGPLGLREYEAFDLPYLFDNAAELDRVTQGPIGQGLLKKMETKGIVGLAYWDNGFRNMSANKPLKKPEDCKGLKFRIPSSKVLDAEIRALGGIPQVMSFSELYQGLQTGVVDGTEASFSNIYSQKLHEVQKYITLTEHSALLYAVIVNKKFWDGLPPDIRTTLEGAMKDASKYAHDLSKKENDDSLEGVRKSGKSQVIVLTPAEKAEWKKAMVKTHKEFEDKIGKDLLSAIYKETGFKPN
ncbi:MAG: TRAP transporter substrate-binding protein [Betaproteobacteria bacterium]